MKRCKKETRYIRNFVFLMNKFTNSIHSHQVGEEENQKLKPRVYEGSIIGNIFLFRIKERVSINK